MKKGFELFTTRNMNNVLDVAILEKLYRISLPPIYRLFVETFDIGEDQIKYDKLIVENSLYKKCITYFIYELNNEIVFAGFNELSKVLYLQKEVDEWVDKAYLPIGYCGFNGGILLGTKGIEIDKIILHNFDREPYFTIIANNIFEFVRGLVLVPNSLDEFNPSSIYKNWGEDFWRVRVEETQ